MAFHWDSIFERLEASVSGDLPSVSLIAETSADPFKILISTIISLRTKDKVTIEASRRLFNIAPDVKSLFNLSISEIEELIYPACFFRNKAKSIKESCKIIIEEHNSVVPDSQKELLALPGVGLKTANLVLGLGFGKEYVCVDTHVHRISNRLGWINTKDADESEAALSKILPKDKLIRINELLVLFGQQICKPISPFCSKCCFVKECPKIGVEKSR